MAIQRCAVTTSRQYLAADFYARVRVTLLLADFAKGDQLGEIAAIGMGWKNRPTPLPPHALVLFLDIDWDQTNRQHSLTCDLLTTDGQAVTTPGPLGPQPVRFGANFEAGRPPGTARGAPLRLGVAINIPGFTPLAPGRYEWRATIEGFPDATVAESFGIVAMPMMQMPQPPPPPTPPEADA
jgi:hypothetical protein